MASDGISGFGATLSGASTGAIAQITSISVSGMEVDDLDVTTMLSPNGWKEFVAGLKDASEIALQLLYFKTAHNTIQGALGSANEAWTVTLADSATFVCSGYIKSLGIESPMEDKMTQSCTIKLSGEPEFTP